MNTNRLLAALLVTGLMATLGCSGSSDSAEGAADAIEDTASGDAAVIDAGETDAGETDAGETDAGETDTGETDTGETLSLIHI